MRISETPDSWTRQVLLAAEGKPVAVSRGHVLISTPFGGVEATPAKPEIVIEPKLFSFKRPADER
jgi:hypothetical protein